MFKVCKLEIYSKQIIEGIEKGIVTIIMKTKK